MIQSGTVDNLSASVVFTEAVFYYNKSDWITRGDTF